MAFFNKKAEELIKFIKLIELIKLEGSELFYQAQSQSTNKPINLINLLPNPLWLFANAI